MACMFIDGLDTARYSKCVDDLANQYLKSQDEYPKTLQEALNYVSEYADSMKKTSGRGVQFAQRTIHCYNCGEEGHISRDCKKEKKKGTQAMQVAENEEDEITIGLPPDAGYSQIKGKNRFILATEEARRKRGG